MRSLANLLVCTSTSLAFVRLPSYEAKVDRFEELIREFGERSDKAAQEGAPAAEQERNRIADELAVVIAALAFDAGYGYGATIAKAIALLRAPSPAQEKPKSPCPHCGTGLLWSEDRGAHCGGCDDFDPKADLPAQETPESVEEVALKYAWHTDEPRADGWAWIRNSKGEAVAEMPHSLAQDVCRKQQTSVTLAALDAAPSADAQPQLEWIRQNCKVVYFPKYVGAYPIEHTMAANKDMWQSLMDSAAMSATPEEKP